MTDKLYSHDLSSYDEQIERIEKQIKECDIMIDYLMNSTDELKLGRRQLYLTK